MDLLDELKALEVDVEAGRQRLGGNKYLSITPVQDKVVDCINKYM